MQKQAAETLAKRQAARKNYIDFLGALGPLVPARHHRLLIDKLQRVADGHCKRLMVFMPPGSAKSFYANVRFAPWYLGRNPNHAIITTSYGQELASKWGRRSRNIVGSQRYRSIFGFGLAQGTTAVDNWMTERGGEYIAAGVGGPITGNRADGGLIDDPVKGREEADSETMRAKIKEWYANDFWTRLKPGAWVILIQTRWHEDDLAGWLLEEAKIGGEQWEVVSLPMIAEENDALGRAIGEPLWPEWFTSAMVSEAKRDARRWSALYQQRPTPDEGAYFKREWIKWYADMPPLNTLKIYGASDFAVTADANDYTVHGIFGVDPNDDIYILDWWRMQATSDVWVETQLNMASQWEPLAWAEESGQIEKGVGPFIQKRQHEDKNYFWRRQFVSSRDKPTRARAIQARMAMGKVYFPRNRAWATDLVDELMRFPAGTHDDQVDTLSLLGRMLAMLSKGEVPERVRIPKALDPEPITIDALMANRPKPSGRI